MRSTLDENVPLSGEFFGENNAEKLSSLSAWGEKSSHPEHFFLLLSMPSAWRQKILRFFATTISQKFSYNQKVSEGRDSMNENVDTHHEDEDAMYRFLCGF